MQNLRLCARPTAQDELVRVLRLWLDRRYELAGELVHAEELAPRLYAASVAAIARAEGASAPATSASSNQAGRYLEARRPASANA
jgi:hypothetical protein